MLEGGGHAIDMTRRQTDALCSGPPTRHGLSNLRCNGPATCRLQAEPRRHGKQQTNRSSSVALVEREGVNPRPHIYGAGVHVERRRNPPASRIAQKSVIAQMIIGIRDQHIEAHAPPQLLEIGCRRRSIPADEIDDLEVAVLIVMIMSVDGSHRGNHGMALLPRAIEPPEKKYGTTRNNLKSPIRHCNARTCCQLQRHGFPSSYRPLVVVFGKLGNQETAVAVANTCFGTRATQRRSRRQHQRNIFGSLAAALDPVRRRKQRWQFDQRRNRPTSESEKLFATRVLEAKCAETRAIIDPGKEIDGIQRPRLPTLSRCTDSLDTTHEPLPPAIGSRVCECSKQRLGRVEAASSQRQGGCQCNCIRSPEPTFLVSERSRSLTVPYSGPKSTDK